MPLFPGSNFFGLAVFEDGREGGNFCESPTNGEKARTSREREHGEYTRNESDRPRGRSDTLKLVPAMVREVPLLAADPRGNNWSVIMSRGLGLEADSYSAVAARGLRFSSRVSPFSVVAQFHER